MHALQPQHGLGTCELSRQDPASCPLMPVPCENSACRPCRPCPLRPHRTFSFIMPGRLRVPHPSEEGDPDPSSFGARPTRAQTGSEWAVQQSVSCCSTTGSLLVEDRSWFFSPESESYWGSYLQVQEEVPVCTLEPGCWCRGRVPLQAAAARCCVLVLLQAVWGLC